MKFALWYNKNYKKLLILSVILILASIIYLITFSIQNDSIIHKDVSLTGGVAYTIETNYSINELNQKLAEKYPDFSTQSISDGSGNQIQIIVTVQEEDSEKIQEVLEEILEIKLTEDNSSIESTSSNISEDFFKQLIISIILAFFWMAAVVFLIFAKGHKIKLIVIFINILLAIYLGNFFLSINSIVSFLILGLFTIGLAYIYIKNSIPSVVVILSAFANITLTLAVVNLLGMKISTAGIVAFLMLIGYSVDTDILLTTRVLNKKNTLNKEMFGALKTGLTMSATTIIAVSTALIIVIPFASVLNQIFTILLIGLGFDLFSTWITNASILKWHIEKTK